MLKYIHNQNNELRKAKKHLGSEGKFRVTYSPFKLSFDLELLLKILISGALKHGEFTEIFTEL